ncbi:MAG: hypothetical protein E5W82_32860 [Mesorhizobium sp.]|nr:MAG: hypothetical protein E5W82_32860 [Mesorhizobium sp.]
MLFEPLNLDGRKRSAVYHAERLSMLHDRLAKKIEQVDHAADQVEQAAAFLSRPLISLPSLSHGRRRRYK